MSLDALWEIVKNIKYPINDREVLQKSIGENIIEFEGHKLHSRDIALEIHSYPIHKPTDVIKCFLDAFEEFSKKDGEKLDDVLEKPM